MRFGSWLCLWTESYLQVAGKGNLHRRPSCQEQVVLRIKGMLWTKVNWLQSYTLINEEVSHSHSKRRGLRKDGKSKCIAWELVEEEAEKMGRESEEKWLYKENQGLGAQKQHRSSQLSLWCWTSVTHFAWAASISVWSEQMENVFPVQSVKHWVGSCGTWKMLVSTNNGLKHRTILKNLKWN